MIRLINKCLILFKLSEYLCTPMLANVARVHSVNGMGCIRMAISYARKCMCVMHHHRGEQATQCSHVCTFRLSSNGCKLEITFSDIMRERNKEKEMRERSLTTLPLLPPCFCFLRVHVPFTNFLKGTDQ